MVLWLLVVFIIGGFPTGVFLSKRKYGLDVREVGSGNIGASNVRRVFGWYAGFLTFLIDFLKGAIPLALVAKSGASSSFIDWAGIFLVLGHCFSPFLGFKGGKGVATSLGCMVVVEPLCAGVALFTYLGALVFSKISAVGSLAGVGACLIYLAVFFQSIEHWKLILALCIIIVWRHQENIKRLYHIKKPVNQAEKRDEI